MPNISYLRPEIANIKPRWDLIKDCLSGQKAVKEAGTKYLPKPNPSDNSPENKDRYANYLERAVFYNVTGRTHQGLVGQVFQKDPVIKIGKLLEPLLADADGSGVDLVQQAKKTLGEVLGFGRCGLLTDYPKTEQPATREQINSGEMRPIILLFEPWSIINWRVRARGSAQVLELVVIQETYMTSDDGFEAKHQNQFRVLSLDPLFLSEEDEKAGKKNPTAGFYRVGLWRVPEQGGDLVEVDKAYPTDSTGKNLDFIPFTFVGAVNNDPLIDLPPMYDLASLNIAHFRNSADYEESCYMVGQPTPVLSGLTKDWVDNVLKGKVHLGSRKAIPLPVGASASLLQAGPNSMPKEAMEIKERQMVALGARLIESRSVARTLGEARLELATEISVLGSCSMNVAEAYENALEWAGLFVGETTEPEFELSPEFELGKLTAQEQAQLVANWQANAITLSEMRDAMLKAGVATLDLDAYKAELDSTPPNYGLGAKGSALPNNKTVPAEDPSDPSGEDKSADPAIKATT